MLEAPLRRAFSDFAAFGARQIVSGGTPDTGEARYWDGDVVWLTPKDVGRPRPVVVAESERTLARAALSEGKARLVPKGTVLLSSRAPIGHLAIAGKDLATNQGFKNIICSDQLHNRFLFHVLRGSIAELEALGRGNTFLEIPAKVVKDFRIPVPPLPYRLKPPTSWTRFTFAWLAMTSHSLRCRNHCQA